MRYPYTAYDEFEEPLAIDPYARPRLRRRFGNVLEFDPYQRQHLQAAPAPQPASPMDLPPRREPSGGYGPTVQPERAVEGDAGETSTADLYRQELLKPRGKLSTIGGILSSIFLGRDIPGQMRGQRLGALQEAVEEEQAEQQQEWMRSESERRRGLEESREAREAASAQREAEAHERYESPEQRSAREAAEAEQKRRQRIEDAQAANLQPGTPEYNEYVYGVKHERPDVSLSDLNWAEREARAEGLQPGSQSYQRRVAELRKSLQREPSGGGKKATPAQKAAAERRKQNRLAELEERLRSRDPRQRLRVSSEELRQMKQRIQDDYESELAVMGEEPEHFDYPVEANPPAGLPEEAGQPSGQPHGKPLDPDTAAAIMKEAGGDKEKARQLARQRGYVF